METLSLGIIGCLGVGFGSYAIKNYKFPHISECGCIGKCYRILGIHDHECFDITVEIIEVFQVTRGKKYIVEIEYGRFNYKTSHNQETEGKVCFYEKINIHVRQCDTHITLKLYCKELLKNKLVGTLVIGVDELLREQLPRRRIYTMDLNDYSTSKIMLSFYRLEDIPDNTSPLMMQALLECPNLNPNEIDSMSPVDQLRIFAKVITGPLKRMNLFGPTWTEFHFVPIEISQTKWEWRYWGSRSDFLAKKKHLGAYSFLGISTIVPDESNKLHFYVKYYDKNGVYDLVFKRVDRNRDIWTQGLIEFITRQRNIISKNNNNNEIGNNIVKNSIKIESPKNINSTLNNIIADMSKEMYNTTM